jgi:hypothetical protein
MRTFIGFALALCVSSVIAASLVIHMPPGCKIVVIKAADGKQHLGCAGDPSLPKAAK